MSGQKTDSKEQTKSPVLSKSSENTAPRSTRPASTESSSATEKQSKGPAKPEPTKATTTEQKGQLEDVNLDVEEAPFEDVDLSDPPPDEPSFERVEHRDAPHSSYNTQQDHKWKYPEGFGKDQKKDGDGKGAK